MRIQNWMRRFLGNPRPRGSVGVADSVRETPSTVSLETNPKPVSFSQPDFDLLPKDEWKAAIEGHYSRFIGLYREVCGTIFQEQVGDQPDAYFDWLVGKMELADGMCLLDAGCGIGGPAVEIARRSNVRIFGITLGETLEREAADVVSQAGLADRIRIVNGDYHDMKDIAVDQRFDRVYFLESIGYSYDLNHLLESVYAVLKPGGRLIIRDWFSEPIPADPIKGEQQMRGREVIYREWQYLGYEKSEWESRLACAGFQIRSAETFPEFGNPAHRIVEFSRKAGLTYMEELAGLGYAPDIRSLIVAEKPA